MGPVVQGTVYTQALKPLLLRGVTQTAADRAAEVYFDKVPERTRVQLG